jgi:hypothetical protein
MIDLLVGHWVITRRVVDLESGVEGRFAGEARFERDGEGLRWRERGRLRFGSYDGEAVREYRIAPAGDGWVVQFADGRPFHPLELDGRPVEHLCGDDRYAGEYTLRSPDALDVVWHVSGPRKRQRIESAYRRA